MTAKYWQKGEVLDYKASAAVKNGEVVSLGTRIGVAGEDIAAGETGHLHVVGVFEMEKATGDVTMGAALYYSATGMCRRVTLPPLRPAQTKPYW